MTSDNSFKIHVILIKFCFRGAGYIYQEIRNNLHLIIGIGLFYILSSQSSNGATVPYIVCSGQDLPSSSPRWPSSINIEVPGIDAKKLSLYAGGFTSLLAPRGWKCDEEDTDAFGEITIYPRSEADIDGPRVEVSFVAGDIAGARWDVEEYECHYFSRDIRTDPFACKHGALSPLMIKKENSDIENVPESVLLPIPFYKEDKLTYINRYLLRYVTPSRSLGLGTSNLFDPTQGYSSITSSLTTDGFLIWGPLSPGVDEFGDSWIHLLKVRLEKEDTSLTEVIMNFSKKCYLEDLKSFCILEDSANMMK